MRACSLIQRLVDGSPGEQPASYSLEEEGLESLVIKHIEVLNLAILLHLEVLLVGDTALEALVVLLLEREELGEVVGRSDRLGGIRAVSHTQVPDLVNFALVQVLQQIIQKSDNVDQS